MILVDSDILSAFAKIDAVHPLFELFQTNVLTITEGVFGEIQHSAEAVHPFAHSLSSMVNAGKIRVVHLTPDERVEMWTLPETLGRGERESIAVLRKRNGILLSNESRVRHYCRQMGIPCVSIPDILRSLWQERVTDREEVLRLISELVSKDRMRFTERTLQAILTDSA